MWCWLRWLYFNTLLEPRILDWRRSVQVSKQDINLCVPASRGGNRWTPYLFVFIFMSPFEEGHIVLHNVGPSVRLSVGRPNGFRSLSWKQFITGLSYFTCWLILVLAWPLLVLGSLSQRCNVIRVIFVKEMKIGFCSLSRELFITELHN